MSSASGNDFDLIVLGGGSGGLAGAFRAAQYGARVALLEPGALGGTCVNVGCVPKKAMWLAADLAQKIAMAQQLGFAVPEGMPPLDWPVFIAHRQRYIENIHGSYRRRIAAAGIVLLPQRGRLVARDTVECDDGVSLQAGRILIATGGHPWRPDIPGAELGIVSDGFFNLGSAPERVAIVGGGYIAVELAGVLQALGSHVHMFVRGRRLLAGFDDDLTLQLAEDYIQNGTRVHFGHFLASVYRADGIVLRDSDQRDSDPFDTVIFATGRRPNTAGLGLEALHMKLGPRGHIDVDARQDTSVEGIHAVGDVTENVELTPVAIAAARRLMDRLFGGMTDAKLDYSDIATVVFAHPPLGKVGLTEAEARQAFGDSVHGNGMSGDNVHVYRAGFRPMLHALADSPHRSLFKLVCVGRGDAPQDQRVVGIHLLGEAADEILQGFAVALKRGITMADLRDTVAIHPTSAEELVLM